ncbi:ArsR/SmtB family transcription factor [Saccharopolyspora phatthalungensis]|uniref:DNA-binding transcriptional ArsR family regulator n=1 Tax=Saccharopolyspora phatthalungensis TaxID=664693 RepID=A0A840QJR8_9PSEU|nr:helix-turn-helix transcriptional regulator [Saccharopolyspora phatthalungensis]MBB5158243.1 DNA-binding transcriptional ArsR family regulator [Saccharopolyspora phatthalungensis]
MAVQGDSDIAPVAALFAEPGRANVLQALADGRALPASVLAGEAGLSASAASAHLAKLRDGGLIEVERSGRHRYYRIADNRVAAVLEALAAIAPARPVRSLRQGTRAAAVREARSCYDHLAGRLGVAVTAALLDHGALAAADGIPDTRRRPGDGLSVQLSEHPYRLGPHAEPVFAALGVDLDAVRTGPSRRPLLRFCVDWSEQRHHLAGRLGAALLSALLDSGWLARKPQQRALKLTDTGADGLHSVLGVRVLGVGAPGVTPGESGRSATAPPTQPAPCP